MTPATVALPFASDTAAEAYEGMLVSFPQTLSVTEYYQQGRSGEVVLSSGGRLQQPTAVAAPGPASQAIQAANDLNRITIDDATNAQNADPIFGEGGNPLTASNPLRGGDTVTEPRRRDDLHLGRLLQLAEHLPCAARGGPQRHRACAGWRGALLRDRKPSSHGPRSCGRLAEGRQFQRAQLLPHPGRRR